MTDSIIIKGTVTKNFDKEQKYIKDYNICKNIWNMQWFVYIKYMDHTSFQFNQKIKNSMIKHGWIARSHVRGKHDGLYISPEEMKRAFKELGL